MPNPDQILSDLSTIASLWYLLAIAWHLYFAILGFSLVVGIRPSKRTAAIVLVLPLLCVSTLAWLSAIPVDGALTGLAAIGLLLIAIRLPQEKVQIGSSWLVSMGILLFTAGWLYPHFLQPNLLATYLYAAPTGLIPCPTLTIITGLSLMVSGRESRSWSLVLGGVGLFYGLVGVVHLGISMDLFLVVGALLSIMLVFLPRTGTPSKRLATSSAGR